ncbi:MAG: hypothetical protein IT328_27880 [Caldilineaceae bacterium]|nr:hypothetical protein [Caldilineaceae bacterium]
MNNHNGIITTVERKSSIAQASPQRYTTIQRAAESLSRRNADAAVVELFMEAMQRLCLLAYEVDVDGFCNIDPVTHRLLLPAPWGRAGHKRWGIMPSESVVLREMIQQRQIGHDGRAPGLWLYDRTRRCWRLNLFDFDTVHDGQRYWQRWPLTVAEYRQARSRRLGDGVAR